MRKIHRFEDIEAWQMARELTVGIYQLTRKPEFSRDYGMKDQIQRVSVSVMNNIAEGFERSSNKDFSRFLFISRGSVGEVRACLCGRRSWRYFRRKVREEQDFLLSYWWSFVGTNSTS